MYARLCLRLSKEAPNFENPPEPSTFRLLLLNKCRDEFENRSKANDAFDLQYGPLGPEDEERRQNAKRKMLGNIKFIGELGKLDILGESILHRCIHQLLLEKNKKETGREGNDMTEDLELLCQIMRTCGRNLDIKGEKLMDQYFQRMALHAENQKLPIRIRFMLRDVLELRMCRWVPREATSTEGPQLLHQIQPRDMRDPSKNNQAIPSFMPKNDPMPNNRYRDRPMRGGQDFNMGNYKNNSQKDNMRNGDYFGQRHQEQNYNSNKQQNYHRNNAQQNSNSNMNNYQDHEYNNTNSAMKNDLPPHFTEKIKLVHQTQISLEDLSLRPAPESMMFGRNNSKQHGGAGNSNIPRNHLSKPMSTLNPPLQKELPIKQISLEKNKVVKKEKPVTKEPTMESLMEEFNTHGKLQESDQKIPDKLIRPFLQAVLIQAVDKTDSDNDKVCNLISQLLKKQANSISTHFLDAFRNVLAHIEGNEGDKAAYTNLACYSLHAISEGIVTLAKLADLTENGANNSYLLLMLQELHKTDGEAKVTELFNKSKVNLLKQLPEGERNKEHLLKTLEAHKLAFLLPLLGIQTELWKQLQVDPNPTVFYKWVKENVDAIHHTNPEFVNSLMTVIVKYIVLEGSKDVEQDGAVEKPDKERILLDKFKPVLQVFIHDHVDLQVTALYALQTFCHSVDFPKGLLLRWFVNLYELEIVEEEAFLKWKENVTDEYPGKGKALFQVNSWLVWLETTESEGEDEDDV